MELVTVGNRKQEEMFLRFRKQIYASSKKFVDNSYFMLQEIFGGKLHFVKNAELVAFYVEDEAGILCEGVIAYAKEMPDTVMLCFFEALQGKM